MAADHFYFCPEFTNISRLQFPFIFITLSAALWNGNGEAENLPFSIFRRTAYNNRRINRRSFNQFPLVLFLNTHYINLSMFFAFAALFPETRLLLFFIIPVKVKWLAYFDAALFIYGMIVSPFPLSLLPAVAILNFFIFCGDILISSIGTFRRRYSPQAINFRKASKQVHRNQVNRTSTPYRRKCAVCGRTDTDYPNLEFRYCSRCAGYHCFCIDHINSHIHFKE
jgi:hypothetical protein